MTKWILTDHRIISSDLNPKIPVAVVIDKSYSKMILDGMNEARAAILKIEQLKDERRQLKLKIVQLEAKLSRLAKHCEDTGVGVPHPGGKRKRKVTTSTTETQIVDVPVHRNYKQKECPGCCTRPPHMFTPKSGRQVMCDACKIARAEIKKRTGIKLKGRDTVRISWRGQGPCLGVTKSESPKEGVITDKDLVIPKNKPVVEEPPKRLSVEEVLRLPDGPEKKQLEAQFTVAEKMEAAKVRYKIQRDQMRAMRNKGFDPDHPIVGVNASGL